nr:N-6 DNA methylase [Flavobacteriales bacterium]
KQNRLRKKDIEKIVAAYQDFKEIPKYSHVAAIDEIKENDFNLNIPRYVDTFEEEEPVDMEATKHEIAQLEQELVAVKAEMEGYLKELNL